jgi:Protein kinase domain
MDKKEIREQDLSAQVRRVIYTMRSLSHKHIVSMCEVLTSNTKLYIVIKLVTGGELFDRLERHRRVDETASAASDRGSVYSVNSLSAASPSSPGHNAARPQDRSAVPAARVVVHADVRVAFAQTTRRSRPRCHLCNSCSPASCYVASTVATTGRTTTRQKLNISRKRWTLSTTSWNCGPSTSPVSSTPWSRRLLSRSGMQRFALLDCGHRSKRVAPCQRLMFSL